MTSDGCDRVAPLAMQGRVVQPTNHQACPALGLDRNCIRSLRLPSRPSRWSSFRLSPWLRRCHRLLRLLPHPCLAYAVDEAICGTRRGGVAQNHDQGGTRAPNSHVHLLKCPRAPNSSSARGLVKCSAKNTILARRQPDTAGRLGRFGSVLVFRLGSHCAAKAAA
jgi:hypothetical protein